MKIEAHQLVGSCVEYLRCTKCSRLLETIDTVVLHSTDGANAMSSAHYLARNDTSVSAHLVVARSGRVIQLLPFNVRAWHAGVSEYEGRKQLNDFRSVSRSTMPDGFTAGATVSFPGSTGNILRGRCSRLSKTDMLLIIMAIPVNRSGVWRKFAPC